VNTLFHEGEIDMRAIRLSVILLIALPLLLGHASAFAQGNGATVETVNGLECVTYPETGPIDLQYCVRRNFSYVSMDGEGLVTHERLTTTFTIINGQPVNCVQVEMIVIANDEIRYEKGRTTCP
jgi:hypothetical protein